MGVIIANNLIPEVEYIYREKENRIIPRRKKIDGNFTLIVVFKVRASKTTE
jgi:hypothetical protein